MKHHEEEDCSATSRYVFQIIRIHSGLAYQNHEAERILLMRNRNAVSNDRTSL
jgi:hypothetical protein